ncbi:lipoprotein, putative [Edwardsiella ictaluri 93-146]|uniref:Lipoprotein, putative n=1 Tax=Edwardsiella ictaluri (strain 93-146) TaxID=634503 RepID=C5BCA1_EDWI9|nr:lipoprotein, putative [Edwardsiella ictaluri 93-146]
MKRGDELAAAPTATATACSRVVIRFPITTNGRFNGRWFFIGVTTGKLDA